MPDADISSDDTIELYDASTDDEPPSLGKYHSVVEQLQKTQWNEFSKMHQKGIDLYQKTFPGRPITELIPWQPVT